MRYISISVSEEIKNERTEAPILVNRQINTAKCNQKIWFGRIYSWNIRREFNELRSV